jgi:hypothetical protein
MATRVSTRLHLLQALQLQLEGITEFNGYDFDLSGKVLRGRTLITVTQPDECKCGLPCLSIVESPRPDFSIYAGEDDVFRKDTWVLLIQGLVLDEKQTMQPSDKAYELAAAVEERLSRINAVNATNGDDLYPDEKIPLINKLQIAPPVIRAPDGQVSALAFFFMPIRLEVAVDSRSPYTTVD